MNLVKLKKFQHWSETNTSASLSFQSEPKMGKAIGKNSYSASIMNDLVLEKARKVLLSKQKEFKEERKRKQAKRFDSNDSGGQ